MFQVGDKVVHPMHGAGVIDSIVREKISGKAMELYVFKMPISGLTLKIPTENSAAIGIRAIKSRSEIEAVIAHIPKLSIDMTSNWNHRYRENMDRLKSGDLDEVSAVIKALMHRDRHEGFPTASARCCTSPSRSSCQRSFWQKTWSIPRLRGVSTPRCY